MTTPAAVLRRAGRLAALVLAALAAADLLSVPLALLQGADPTDWASLLAPPVGRDDLLLTGLILAVLALEGLSQGWARSALRRLLTSDDASVRTDLFYFVANATGLAAMLGTVATLGLGLWLNRLLAAGLGLPLAVDLPPWAAFAVLFLWQSLAVYWCHRLVHTRLFWPVHAVHHAITEFTVVAGQRHHPVDAFPGYLILGFVPALLGFPPDAVLAVVLAVSALDVYQHSALPSLPWVERHVCFGPRGHALHHSADPRWFDRNFGGDLVVWDKLFGTFAADVDAPVALGTDDPHGVFQSGRPLRDIVAVQRLWLAGASAILRERLGHLRLRQPRPFHAPAAEGTG